MVMIAVAAVIKNPLAGCGFVENLGPEIRKVAPVLGELLTTMILERAGADEVAEGYGESVIAGVDGEVEHTSALIPTPRFANHYRTAASAKSYLSFCNTRRGASALIMIPLMDKNDEGRHSNYLTIHFAISYQRPVQLTCAQLLVVIEVTVLGSFAKKFHALQQASTISS